MADSRNCERCGRAFEPKREHARFCSARCRVAWNRERYHPLPEDRQPAVGADGQARASALDWSIIAMREATGRLGRVGPGERPQAFAAVGEAVWAVTIVDATLVRYYQDGYDAALDGLPGAERRLTEGTFGGLRFVRNRMGYHADHADFILPASGPGAEEVPVTAWTWRAMPEPEVSALPPRGRTWEMARYQTYADYLAGAPVGETFDRAAEFLLKAAASVPGMPSPISPGGQSMTNA